MLRLTRVAVLLGLFAFPAIASSFPQEVTSENNDRLRQGLARFPAADTDGDGVLTMAEARAFMQARAGSVSRPRRVGAGKEVDLATLEKSGKGLWVASTGHSLVAPALGPFGEAAKLGGFDGHLQVRQLSGGATGSPGSLWVKPEPQQVVKRALATGKCDVLTMGSHSEGSTVEDLARWIDLALEHNPDTVVYVMDAWPHLHELLDMQGKKTTEADATLENYEQKMGQFNGLIRKAVDQLNKKFPGKVHVIPIGNAMLDLVRRQLDDELPGVDAIYVPGKKGENNESRVGLYRDRIHPTAPVATLEGYLYYACLYKKNPVDLPKGLYRDAELDRILREVAWKTVTEHPLSGVTEKQAAGGRQ
jgi:hypothetical protein